jgi:excisionase family DNA binding protein
MTDLNFYSVQQVATMTGMSVDWLWKQCRTNKIPHHKLGSKYRFTADDLKALAAQSAVTPPDEDDELLPIRSARRRR